MSAQTVLAESSKTVFWSLIDDLGYLYCTDCAEGQKLASFVIVTVPNHTITQDEMDCCDFCGSPIKDKPVRIYGTALIEYPYARVF